VLFASVLFGVQLVKQGHLIGTVHIIWRVLWYYILQLLLSPWWWWSIPWSITPFTADCFMGDAIALLKPVEPTCTSLSSVTLNDHVKDWAWLHSTGWFTGNICDMVPRNHLYTAFYTCSLFIVQIVFLCGQITLDSVLFLIFCLSETLSADPLFLCDITTLIPLRTFS